MLAHLLRLSLLACGLPFSPGPAGAASPLPDLRVTLRQTRVPLRSVLDSIRRQTGVLVQDLGSPPDRPVDLDLDRVPVWQAIDTIARQSRTRATVGGKEPIIRLVPSTDTERSPVCYDGPFRIRLLRISATRDLDSDRRGSTAVLEVTWLPSLRPLFVDAIAHDVLLRDRKGQVERLASEGSSLVAVEGQTASTLDLALPGFDRAESVIATLEGTIPAVVPSRFLTFRFVPDLAALQTALPGGALRQTIVDEVVCRIDRLQLAKGRYSIGVELSYPAGGKQLESFQASSLVAQNEMLLVSGDDKRRLRPSGYVIDEVGSRRARVTYHFTPRAGEPLPAPRELFLHYSAPARIVDVSVRFAFRNVPLP